MRSSLMISGLSGYMIVICTVTVSDKVQNNSIYMILKCYVYDIVPVRGVNESQHASFLSSPQEK